MYESPINLVTKQIQTEISKATDEYALKVVQECGVVVDKEELIKALNYDRQQYEKGYADAKAELLEADEWCPGCKEYDQKRHSCPRFNRVIRETLNEVEERQKGLEAKFNRLPSLSTPSIGFCAWCKYREKNGYCNEHKLYCDEFDYCSRWERMCGADMRGEHDE